MKYVGLCHFEGYMYALREDGHVFRIRHEFYTNVPVVEGEKRVPLVEVEECLHLPMWRHQ